MKIAKYEKVSEWTIMEQIRKICEEVGELRDEAMCNGLSKQKVLAEGFDVVQATMTLFFILGYTEEDIKTHMSFHRQKLEIRDHEGRIKIDEWIEV